MSEQVIFIKKPAHFSWKECLWFLDRGYDDCLFSIHDDTITKLVTINDENILLQVTEKGEDLTITSLSTSLTKKKMQAIKAYMAEWFDLDRDIAPFYALLEADERLSFMTREYAGLRLIGIPDLYEALCWSIIGQQINLSFAYRLKRRLVEHYGSYLEYEGKMYHAFPPPRVLAALTVADLAPLQFSGRKAEYIIGISRLFASRLISREQVELHADYELMIRELTNIRGIGIWTANYALMKSLKVMNSIPYGDSGLNKALCTRLGFPGNPGKDDIDEYFQPYRGWQAYLVFYLWRTLSHPKQ